MTKFYAFMISNTKWNLPVWGMVGALTAATLVQLVHNIINFIGA